MPTVIREPESGWWALQEDPDESMVTVAVVGESPTRRDTEAVVSCLAELAAHDELLVVYGAEPCSLPGHQAVTAGLRSRLPRHDVVALHVDPHDGSLRRDAALALEHFLDEGSLPVVVTAAVAVPDLTAEISSRLRADRVLRVSHTSTGADLHQVWRRQPMNAR